MKAPAPDTAKDAVALGQVICEVVADLWKFYNEPLVLDAWRRFTFQHMVDNDWEHTWTDEQCQQIMAGWIAHRLER